MNNTLAPSQFTSPDIRPSGLPGLYTPPVGEQAQALDMEQIQEELAAALRHIEELPNRYP